MKKSLLFGSAALAALFLFAFAACGKSGDATSPVTPPPSDPPAAPIAARSFDLTVAEGDDAFKVSAAGGSLAGGLKVYIKDDGTAVTITKADSLDGFTALASGVSQSGLTIVVTGLTPAASGGTDGVLDSDNEVIPVTLAADAQSSQVSSISGLSKAAIVFPGGTYTLVGATSTTADELYYDSSESLIQVGDGSSGTTDCSLDADIDAGIVQQILPVIAALQAGDTVTYAGGVPSAVVLNAAPAGTAAFNTILGFGAADITLADDAGFTVSAGGILTIPAGVNLTLDGAAIILTNDETSPAKIVFAGEGAALTAGGEGETPLTEAGGVFAAYDSTAEDVIPVSSFSELTITGGEGDLNTIVCNSGTPYITGPKSSGGSAASISAATDCAD